MLRSGGQSRTVCGCQIPTQRIRTNPALLSGHRHAPPTVVDSHLGRPPERPGGCSEPAPTASDFADLPIDLVNAFCDWQARCCTAPKISSASYGRYATAAQCQSAGLELSVRDQLGLVAASIDEGRVVVNSDLAEGCIADYRNRPCNGTGAVTTPSTGPDVDVLLLCPGAFVGKVPLGRRCDTIVDCVDGAHCYTAPPTLDGILRDRSGARGPVRRRHRLRPRSRLPDLGLQLRAGRTDGGAPDGGAPDGGAPDGGAGPACTGA